MVPRLCRAAVLLGIVGAWAPAAPCAAGALGAGQTAAAPGSSPDRELSRDEIRHFLMTAKIVSGKPIGKGITRPVRVTLTDGTLTHPAAFSSVDERLAIMRYQGGRTELDFVDSYKYNIAAYRIAELLGLDHMMPVTVEREWERKKGSLSWWIDSMMDEGERRKRRIEPPDPAAWNRQMYTMRVFAQLVADTDRNLGNVLITDDWKLRMIDFTRAFRRARELTHASDLHTCDRQLLARLRELTAERVAAATKPYLGGAEVEALLARRDRIVALFDRLVAERGEASVLY